MKRLCQILFLLALSLFASLPGARAGTQCDWYTDPNTGRPYWKCDLPDQGSCEWQTDDSGNPIYVCR